MLIPQQPSLGAPAELPPSDCTHVIARPSRSRVNRIRMARRLLLRKGGCDGEAQHGCRPPED